ncbi:hypothetical protein FB451DRAFT_1568156 [Mycena latifolia]|nr:hypothetical protein FB451DRAFT_1568156 [Mycena latifolia]
MAFSNTVASSGETCMSLPVSCLTGPQSQSFEEVRIADYLASYRATGRPPPPCPPYPTDPAARAAQRLPPLFVPTPFPAQAGGPASSAFGGGPSASAPSLLFGAPTPAAGTAFGTPAAGPSNAATITDPTRLPLVQAFTAPVRAPENEQFASISAAPEYAHFSHDELRLYAYARGARQPPPGTPLFAFVPAPAPVLAPLQIPAPQPGALPQDGSGDQFVSISARPEFAGHSVEELRLSFLRSGAELTSAQIFAGGPSPANARLPGPGGMLPLGQPNPNPLAGFAPHAAPPAAVNAFAPQGPTPLPTPTLFGAPQATQAQGFSFGGAPAPAQPSVFGAPPQPAPQAAQGFSFGAPQLTPVTTPTVFGAPQQQQPQGQPQTSIFGAPPQPAPPAGVFGQPQQAGAGAGPAFSFGAAPAQAGAGGTGFSFGARRGF